MQFVIEQIGPDSWRVHASLGGCFGCRDSVLQWVGKAMAQVDAETIRTPRGAELAIEAGEQQRRAAQ